ncbi:MAG: DUF2974 domain-containing protein [Gammaproteobacteria bacterium]|nr:DUF2974 domain-containing protein [Gammaproteobacteria bacterium]
MLAKTDKTTNTPETTHATPISEWLLLQAIQLVTRGLPDTPNPNEEFDLKDLTGHTWKLHHASHWAQNDLPAIGLEENYRGLILVCDALKKVILVHRGLQLTSPENLADGFSIGANKIPKIVDPALFFSKIACEFADSHEYELTHTGFSLGGFLAQITGAQCHHEKQRHNKVICFDAPGAKKTIKAKGFSDNRSNTTNYLTAPNIVNTITPHYGVVRQITAFQDKNLYLMPELQLLVTDKAASLDIHSPEETGVNALRMLIMGTMNFSHNQDDLRSTLACNPSFAFKKVRAWPVATLSFGRSDNKADDATSKKLVDDWLGITSMILSLSKEILTRSGHEDFNVLNYQLPIATVHHHQDEDQESFCISTHKVGSTFFSPASPRLQTHREYDDKEMRTDSGPPL